MCGPPVLSAGSRERQVHLNHAAAEAESVPCTLVGRGEFPQVTQYNGTFNFLYYKLLQFTPKFRRRK